MAKSKSGGTRALLRGRVGSDVYSVGKDGMGKRQQVVRSLAEVVANPRTENQMFGRMIMSTVMQAVGALSPIIDHSFDGVAKGQPSISEFIRRNYALVKADALAHPASGNDFSMVKYQEKGALVGAYVISSGNAVLPSAVSVEDGILAITLTAGTLTVGGLKAALGLSVDGYITGVAIVDGDGARFVRAKLTTSLADSTAITADNVGSLFTLEGNSTPSVALVNNIVAITFVDDTESLAQGAIASDYIDGAWKHSSCTLNVVAPSLVSADAALATYPTGSEQFLNGGEI